MKYVDEFRHARGCQRLIAQIIDRATQRWNVMEVCGGQTHGLLRYGVDESLRGAVHLIHGPGCPVCVTPLEAIDAAVAMASSGQATIASFGDMLRVPGSRGSLLDARSAGARVRIVFSPLDAAAYARDHPEQEVVFFAVGFETTVPATALAVHQAAQWGLTNFSLLVSHVRVLPAMQMVAASEDNVVQGFLGAGHVCTVTGYEAYQRFVEQYRLPVVVTGFEPVDLLRGILACVELLEQGEARVVNAYRRSVCAEGNTEALRIIEDVYEICDAPWRGLGVIKGGGFRLRSAWSRFDARCNFPAAGFAAEERNACRSGEVLTGRIKPTECEFFGSRCTPSSPMGAPMVSGEGACAAYYRYALQRAVPLPAP